MAADSFRAPHPVGSSLLAWFAAAHSAVRRARPDRFGIGNVLAVVLLAAAVTAWPRSDSVANWMALNGILDEGAQPVFRYFLPFGCFAAVLFGAVAGRRLLAALAYFVGIVASLLVLWFAFIAIAAYRVSGLHGHAQLLGHLARSVGRAAAELIVPGIRAAGRAGRRAILAAFVPARQ